MTRGLGPERSFVLFQVAQNRRSRYILPPLFRIQSTLVRINSVDCVTKLVGDNPPSPPVSLDGSDLPEACTVSSPLRPEWSGWMVTIREVVAEGKS